MQANRSQKNIAQQYIIDQNDLLRKENKALEEQIKNYEEDLEACANDGKTISNLRSISHNINSISNGRKRMIDLYDELRKISIDYIKDFNLYQKLHIFAFFVVTFLSFFNNAFFYALYSFSLLEMWVNYIGITSFSNKFKIISKSIFDEKEICDKEVKNMDFLSELIDVA